MEQELIVEEIDVKETKRKRMKSEKAEEPVKKEQSIYDLPGVGAATAES